MAFPDEDRIADAVREGVTASGDEPDLLRTIVDTIPVMITLYDPDVNVLLLNHEFERVVGWSSDDARHVDVMAACYPDPAYRAEVAAFMERCAGWMDIRMRTRGGRFIETRWTNVRLPDARRVGIGLDVADLKSAEWRLSENEARRSFLLDIADTCRSLDRPEAIADAICAELGGHLGARAVAFLEFDRLGRGPAGIWRAGDDAPALPIEDVEDVEHWATRLLDALAAGEPVIVGRGRDGGALLVAPVIASRGPSAALFVAAADERFWSAAERQLVEEVAERAGGAIAKARAEHALRESESRFRAVFSSIDEGFCLCEIITGADGRPVDYRFLETNPLFEAMTGLADAVGRTALELVPALERHWIEIYGRVALAQESRRFQEGSVAMGREFDVFATAVEPFGRFALVFKDVTAQRRAEQALRDSETRFRTITEAMPQMVWTASPDGRFDFHNARWYEFTGGADQLVGDDWSAFVHPADVGEVRRCWQESLATGALFETEFRLRHHSGRYFWVLGRAVPLHDDAGRVVAWMGTSTDIHAMKEGEAHRQLLIDELNHRVKNTLSVVQAIAQQTFRGHDLAGAARSAFEGRLTALAETHDLLTRENWATAGLAEVVETAVRGCCGSLERYRGSGPDIALRPKTAVTLSLALHELCTNALKHGALSHPAGRITVGWHAGDAAAPRLHLVWQEQGGPPVAPPARSGFGTRMIERALAIELEGTVRLDFAPKGLVCTIDSPLPRAA